MIDILIVQNGVQLADNHMNIELGMNVNHGWRNNLETVTFDIESLVDDKLYPYQQALWDKVSAGGFKSGELMTMTAGRNVGKSMLTASALKRLMDDIMSQPVSELVMSEGKVYGARYHCVEPIGGNWREMEDWCITTFGASTGSIWAEQVDKKAPAPGERWYANNRKFWFRSLKDRDWFIIRWNS